jgi:hypothetical protein
MAIFGIKETHRIINKLSHDFLVFCNSCLDPCVAKKSSYGLADRLVSSSRSQHCLKFCRFTQVVLKTKVCKMESAFPSLGISEEVPIVIFFLTDGVLLEVRNQEERYCNWSLIATISHIATLGYF